MYYHYAHWTVCMYVLLFVTAYFIWTVTLIIVNELGWIYMQCIWQQSILG